MKEEDSMIVHNYNEGNEGGSTDRITSDERLEHIPEISIVIPTYNGERFLAMTLDSVLAQTFTNWECVIVDDGSTDGSAAIAQSYAEKDSRFRLVRQEKNGGIANARNRGIDEINQHSAYVIFLDSDDVWANDALGSLRNALENDRRAVAAHGIGHFIDSNGNEIFSGQLQKHGAERKIVRHNRVTTLSINEPTCFASIILYNDIVTPGLILIRHNILNCVGKFDLTTPPAEDWDMWIRLSRKGDIHFLNRDLLGYRRHDNNISSHSELMKAATYFVYDKAIHSDENDIHHKKIIQDSYRPFQYFYFREKLNYAKSAIAKGEYHNAFMQFGYGVKHFIRYLRGAPHL